MTFEDSNTGSCLFYNILSFLYNSIDLCLIRRYLCTCLLTGVDRVQGTTSESRAYGSVICFFLKARDNMIDTL